MKKLIWGQLYDTKTLFSDALNKQTFDQKVFEKIAMEACSLSGVMFKTSKTIEQYSISDTRFDQELSIILFAETANGILNIKNEYTNASMTPTFGDFTIIPSGTLIEYDGDAPLSIVVIEISGKVNTFMGSSVFLTN